MRSRILENFVSFSHWSHFEAGCHNEKYVMAQNVIFKGKEILVNLYVAIILFVEFISNFQNMHLLVALEIFDPKHAFVSLWRVISSQVKHICHSGYTGNCNQTKGVTGMYSCMKLGHLEVFKQPPKKSISTNVG